MSLESICLAQHLMLVEEALIGPLPFKSRCPRRVNRVILTVRRRLPVYPEQRTSSDRPDWSGSCQEQLTGVGREGGMALIPATVALQGACALRAAIAVSFNRPELPLGVLVLIPRGHAADRLNRITYVVDSDHVL